MSETRPEPQPPEGTAPEESPRPLFPVGTRIALYYILIFMILSLGGTVGIVLLGGLELLEAAAAGEAEIDVALLLWIRVLLTPTVVVTTMGFVHFIDRKPLTAVGAGWPEARAHGAHGVVREILGVLAGAAGVLALWWILARMVLEFEVGGSSSGVLADPAAPARASVLELALFGLGFLATACLEEWIFRGYIYSTLRERLTWVHAAGMTALVFVFLPFLSVDVAAAGLVNTFLLGFALAAIRELTGNLWTAAIFHGSWNFLLGCVLSLPVSGVETPRLFEVTVSGAEAWSGGDYGPEGSWLMTPLLAAAVLALAWAVERRAKPAAGDAAAPG